MDMNRSITHPTLSILQDSAYRQNGFRRDIQGLRAIAVFAVILFHACKTLLPSGFVGVDVFFVISGFIISSLIIESNKAFNWRNFYWGRIKRIVPAYIVMLALVSIVSSLLFVVGDFSFYKKSIVPALLFFSNQYFSGFGSYFSPGAYELPLLHTWSLAIEMQFYLFFPVLVWLTPRQLLPWLIGALCVALFAYAEWQLRLQDNQRYVYYSLFARVPEFLVGALIAFTGMGKNWSSGFSTLAGLAGVVLLCGCFIFIDEKNFPGLASVTPCLATGLLITSREGVVSRVLSMDGFVWIGALSYSLYLWHWPVLAFMRYYLGHYDLTILWLLGFIAITFLFSSLSFHWVENLARDNKSVLAKPISMIALVMTAGIVMLVSVKLNTMVEKPLLVNMTRYAPADKICHGKIVEDCLRGDLGEKPSVLVLGDSHAAQLNIFIDVVGKQEKFAARVITASSCVPIPGFDVGRIPDYARADCYSQIAALAPYIVDEARLIVIAAMWQWHAHHPNFMQTLSAFLKKTTQRNIKVIVLAQVPMFDANPLRIRRFSALGLPMNVSQNKDWEKANSDVAAIVRRYKGATFLNLSHSQFFADAPFYDGQLIYFDNHHLNELGARSYGLFAAPFFKKYVSLTTE